MRDVLTSLVDAHSWRLDRIAPSTYVKDLAPAIRRSLTEAELAALSRKIRSGKCYRCRIGKGPFCYADTPEEAAKMALEHQQSLRRPNDQ